jgi:hypothetical protein
MLKFSLVQEKVVNAVALVAPSWAGGGGNDEVPGSVEVSHVLEDGVFPYPGWS